MVTTEIPSTVGQTVALSCQVDGYYEYCDWHHEDQICKFEWKRWHWAVKKQACPNLLNRVNFIGDYDSHECKVELKNVQLSDAGNWTCKVEAYGFFTRGDIVSKELNLQVIDVNVTSTTDEEKHDTTMTSTFPVSSNTKSSKTDQDSATGIKTNIPYPQASNFSASNKNKKLGLYLLHISNSN